VPQALFPLLGIFDVQQTAAPFANPLIFLFLGGFLIALTVWNLHRRIALLIVLRVGQRLRSLVAGAMLATAALSIGSATLPRR
jgi:solute carrier family 13 (sodium-dependent dicarboxylate transporter), member 2/3/5